MLELVLLSVFFILMLLVIVFQDAPDLKQKWLESLEFVVVL